MNVYSFPFRNTLLGIAGVLGITSCGSKNSVDAIGSKPNIVFILVDDLGYGDLGCYGQKVLTTPNIDKMASEGIRFLNHYTGSSVCGPSRASLMTGKHTGHTSVRGNSPDQLLSDDEPILAKMLKKAGYTTGIIGKWGIGHPPPADDPARKGFDYSYGYINMWHAHNFYPEFLYRNGEKIILEGNKTLTIEGVNPWLKDWPEGTGVADPDHREQYVHDLFDNEALTFIEKNQNKPFFLYLCYNVPHANNECVPDGMEVPTWGEFAEKDWPSQEKGFASMIRNIDNSVGMILEKLKVLGIDEQTMVVFCSDNGPHQEGGHQMEFFDSNGQYRGKKRDYWDGGIKTPFIVRWPGKINENTTTDHICAFWDIMPTFAEIAATESPVTDGISFLPSLLGNNTKQKKHEYLYWEFYEQGGKQAVLKNGYKYIKTGIRGNTVPLSQMLYLLKEDIGEEKDISSKHPDIVDDMERILKEAHTPFSVTSLFNDDGKKTETPF